jgi:hypothetical protein
VTLTIRILVSAALVVSSFVLGLGAYSVLAPARGTAPAATVGIMVPVLGTMFAYLHWGSGTPVARSLYLVSACGVGGLLVLIYQLVVAK